MSSPAVANGVVYMGGGNARVNAFDAMTGSPMWSVLTGGPVVSSPTVVNGVVYVGSDDMKVYALNGSNGASVWSVNLGSAVRSSPAVANGVVYVASRNGTVFALNASTKAFVWVNRIAGSILSSPAVANGLVYIGSDQNLFALSASTGAVIWQQPIGGADFSSPAVANGLVYIGSLANKIWAFNAVNGKLAWSADVGAPAVSSPALVNGVLFIGSDDGFLYAYDALNGTQLWSSHTGLAVPSSPAVANNMVYVGSLDHFLYAFAATDDWPMFHHSPTLTGENDVETTISRANVGTLVTDWTWTCPPTGCAYVQDPAVAEGVVYAGIKANGVSGGSVTAFDAVTGTQRWTSALSPSGDIRGAPAVWNGAVYVGSGNQRLYAFNAVTGAQLWATPQFGGAVDPPTVQNGLIYAVSEGFKAGLHARDPLTGGKVWDAIIATPIGAVAVPNQAPAVANGIVYLGGDGDPSSPPLTMKVFAYDAVTGTARWTASGGVEASGAVSDGSVYWGYPSGSLRAFDATGLTPLWTAASLAPIPSSPAVANGRAVIVGAVHKVNAISTAGTPAWSTPIAGTVISSSPAVANSVVFVCSDGASAGTGIVHALDALSGGELWSTTVPGSAGSSSPAVAHGVVYVGASSGLYAFHLP
jgi:outer membrane protein assembly factor BamB